MVREFVLLIFLWLAGIYSDRTLRGLGIGSFSQTYRGAWDQLIFKESIRINGDDSHDPDVNANTTVQEKNITFPTDRKLHKKIIKKTLQIVQKGKDCPSGKVTSECLKS